MDEIGHVSSHQLIEAVQIWTGWGRSLFPNRDDVQLENRLGKEAAAKILPIVKFLEAEFYRSDARLNAANLQEMEALASAHFRLRHPTIPDEVVSAFAWCYTYDFK